MGRALRDNGIDRIFLVTGGDLLRWRALRDQGIAMHLARSEAASVVMADAYARVTGKRAVVYGQWGPARRTSRRRWRTPGGRAGRWSPSPARYRRRWSTSRSTRS
ncbi:thiamine pyrophosphate-binding protein [Streptomyces misionensis]|uniref:thiamine pyrophosphate-binding protein n=1 Tax=Streptomyces misionensis TaxID=67331 RepID=UPI0036BCB4E9